MLVELGASVKTPAKDGATPVLFAAQEGHAEMVKLLAEVCASVETPAKDGCRPVDIAASNGHAEVIRLLASLKADVISPLKRGHTSLWTPLAGSAGNGHFEATKTLLLGAPITITDLKQLSSDKGDARQLRANLQAWAAEALVQHRIFQRTFLFGCSAHAVHWVHGDIALAKLEGEEALRAEVAKFVGVVVGKELRLTRAMGPAIAAIDWAAYDQP